jgi:hypothetical protein
MAEHNPRRRLAAQWFHLLGFQWALKRLKNGGAISGSLGNGQRLFGYQNAVTRAGRES